MSLERGDLEVPPHVRNLLRPLFHVDDKGNVTTRGGDSGEAPGADPAQFIASRLGSLRPHWFPASVGSGVTGGGFTPSSVSVDCFKPGGTLTAQMSLVAQLGEKVVMDACRRNGIVPPPWLNR